MFLPKVWNYEKREISNPILPISLGQTYITQSQHTALYHINVSYINNCLSNTNFILSQVENILNISKENEQFSYLTLHKLNQTKELLNTIQNNIQLFSKIKREKRGLINAVGKVDKWLFGTLDSDDEEKYDNYFSTLFSNQETLQNNFQNEHTVLTNVISTYTNHIDKIEYNQKILESKIKDLQTKEIDISHVIYLSLLLDNATFQLNTIKHLLERIETAISFAKLGILHNSILNSYQLSELINNIQNKFGNNVIRFEEPIYYYTLFSTQVFIKENIIIFSIHIPIIYPQQFVLYKVFPIPIQNQTILVPKPYILLTENNYWTTSEECPRIEETFICNQDALSKEESCLHKLLTTNQNQCSMVNINFKNTLTERLNGEDILVIPAKPVSLKSNCPTSIRNDKIYTPSIISIGECPLEINEKIFIREEKTKYEYVLEIPEFQISSYKHQETEVHLKEMNTKELLEAQKILETIKFQRLQEPGISTNHWIFPFSTLSLIFLSFVVFAILKFRARKPKQGSSHIEIALDDRKTREPLFSELNEGGVI